MTKSPVVCEPLERRMLFASTILFIRGVARSGGFLEGQGAVPRDGQLADINDTSTAARNTGWGTLAATLRGAGFVVQQLIEGKEANAPATGFVKGQPIAFEKMDLTKYAAIVFGSNNAAYPKASVDAIETYIRNGGGALFISDANFGSDWRDAPNSDQPFLSRFGLIMNQDNGLYPLTRAGGDFAVPGHPVLIGVNTFDGEGVSPVTVPLTPPAGVTITRVVGARTKLRLNNGDANAAQLYKGTLRDVTSRDASLVLGNAGRGRIATYFDRNTFFNANGLGSNINKYDNRKLALNLFGWVADNVPPAVKSGTFTVGSPYVLRVKFNDNLYGSLTRGDLFIRAQPSGVAIPGAQVSTTVTDSAAGTDLVVRIQSPQTPGRYELVIHAGRIRDDAGNLNALIRFNFTIPAPSTTAAVATSASLSSSWRVFDEIFGEQPIAG